MKKRIFLFVFVVLSFVFYLNWNDGLGGGYYVFDDGAPLTGIKFEDNTILVNCELVDYDYDKDFIVAYRRLNKDFHFELDSLDRYFFEQGKFKQFWIIDKNNKKEYSTYDYNEFLSIKLKLKVNPKLQIDTLL